MIVIVLDTNILCASPSLSAPEWQSLGRHREDWKVQIVVPDVVLMETVNVVRRNWKSERQKLGTLRIGEFSVGKELQAITDAIEARSDSYEEDLKLQLSDLGAEVFSVPSVNHFEIAERASLKIPPYQGDKDGYRDTLIWLTLLAIANYYPDDEVWFVSENTSDFGPKEPNWTGKGNGTRSDCPILFHSHLEQELKEGGLHGRVRYVASLGVLEKHLNALHEPIPAWELESLKSAVDFPSLIKQLMEQAIGRDVSPSQAALSLNVVEAFVLGLDADDAVWSFEEAARRGKERWTANYTVDVEIDLIIEKRNGDTSVATKTLRVVGYATFTEPALLEEFDISGIESLPDDPNRALWETPPVTYSDALGNLRWAHTVADLLKTNGHLTVADMLKSEGALQTGQRTVADILRTKGHLTVADLLKTTGSLQSGQTVAEMMKSAGDSQAEQQTMADMQRTTERYQERQHRSEQAGGEEEENNGRNISQLPTAPHPDDGGGS